MDIVKIQKINEVYIKLITEPSIMMELSEYFTFDVPGAKFMPAYKNRVWDGKIRLLNVMTGLLYSGLRKYVESFCQSRSYQVEHLSNFNNVEFSVHEAENFIKSINLPDNITPRDYQIDTFVHGVRENRGLFLSPTSSGKSLMIYLLTRYYNARTLIIVPTISLVSQLAGDFADYGFASDQHVHRIFGGQDKLSDKQITITTWQSVYKMDKEYFQQFDVVIGDEAHLFKSKSLVTIMTKLDQCKYRFGFTGTLDGSETNKLVLEGLFGPVRKVTTTAELINAQHLADFSIKAIVLSYPQEIRKSMIKTDYQSEMDFIVKCEERNKFIRNLCLSLKGNTLLLFQFVGKHGKVLIESLIKEAPNRKIYYIDGSIEGEEREKIRKTIENETNAIIVASYGTFSTGINIRNLHNIIFSSPSKSRVRNLQSIGRVLRKSLTINESVLYDIADDFSYKSKRNYTLLHFMERIKIYNEEKFNYKIYNIDLI